MAEQPKKLSENNNMTTVAAPVRHVGRKGFLPITTNLWDRFFISGVLLVAIHLLWLRFIEFLLPLPIATVISLIIMYVIVRWG